MAFLARPSGTSMEQPVPDFHPEVVAKAQKSPVSLRRPGRFPCSTGLDQPRVRELIMNVSNLYSATCHHRYWSDR